MITIYHLVNSRSDRVIWLMEELGLPYNLERIEREALPFTKVAPAVYKALHPVGKAPIIRDGDLVLIESGAILEYIINRHGGGRLIPPVASADYPRYVQWMHFAEGGAMHQFVQQFTLDRLVTDLKESPMALWLQETTHRYRRYIEEELGTRAYIAGESFTAADIMMMTVVSFMQLLDPVDKRAFPNAKSYLDRLRARPAYQRALSRAQ